LIVPKGNPKQITSLQDLTRDNIRMVNRNKGSGTRLWLDGKLAKNSLPYEHLRGYQQEVQTHTAVAQAVADGKADVGVGLQAAASQFDLDFIPLFQERFDLVLFQEQFENKNIVPLFDFLNSAAFRKIVQSLGGYQTNHSGEKLSP
jgi:putative molybdopterin biosynthesis protein